VTSDQTQTGQVDDNELVGLFPGEALTHDNAEHYRGRLRRQLLINRCTDCRAWHAPPRPVCPQCWSSAVTPTPVSGAGTIFLFTLLHQGPPAPGASYDRPYPVVTVELDEQPGLRFTSTVVDADPAAVVIGARVQLAWRTLDRAPMPVFILDEGGR
jgi:uncharacterized protein